MRKKAASKIVFNSGEYVVYPAQGVGKVSDIYKQQVCGSELELIVVNFDKDKMTLRVPLAKAGLNGLRKISETPVMDKALEVLKGRARIRKIMWSRRAQEYENKINSGNPSAIAEVVRDLHRRENLAEQSYSERQIYEQALDRLASEYAICYNISCEDATQKLLGILNSGNEPKIAADSKDVA
ncbi:MAG: CarD family transcriptional regulator [Alphaproteobacteria bacterium]|nr:CarD family transcriptional regulator [Alphaproteobacteria bacterium]